MSCPLCSDSELKEALIKYLKKEQKFNYYVCSKLEAHMLSESSYAKSAELCTEILDRLEQVK